MVNIPIKPSVCRQTAFYCFAHQLAAEVRKWPLRLSFQGPEAADNTSAAYQQRTKLAGDGNADLITANQTSNNISVLLGTGSGSFGTVTNFTIGTSPSSIVASDLNGDGKLDLIFTNSGANPSIILGTGTGSFGSISSFTAGTTPVSVTAADFNEDGKLDLAVANHGSFNVSILLGNGTGSFGSATNFQACHSPGAIINSDFNGDGHADLVVADNYSGGNDVSVLLGTGTGSFSTATNFTVVGTNTDPVSITTADFDSDGKKDLAIANNATNNISVLLGTGTGSFGTATNFATTTDPRSVISADFNGDGKMDLLTPNASVNKASVLLSCNTTAIEQIKNSNEVNIYPNPNNGNFVIEPNNTMQTIHLYNINGKLVLSQNLNGKTTIDVSYLNDGVYNLSLLSSQGIINRRIVIVK